MELGNSGLLNENVPGELGNVWLGGWVLIELLVFVVVVHIVTNSEEFLVVVGTCQENSSDSNNFRLGQSVDIGRLTLNSKFKYCFSF